MPRPSTSAPAPREALVTGHAANAPAAAGNPLFVTVPSREGQTRSVEGWVGKSSGAMPAVGDECLLAFDENRNAWVVAWA